MRTQDKYILERNGRYYYERRVPTEYAKFDTRRYVKKALKTKSLEVARARRDLLAEADDLYWASISGADDGISTSSVQARHVEVAMNRYEINTQLRELSLHHEKQKRCLQISNNMFRSQ